MRLDEERLEALRSWGERLQHAEGEEFAAAGRAILMLAEEIDRLHIELWHVRMQTGSGSPVETGAAPEDDEQQVASTLHGRLRRALQRDEPVEPEEQPGSPAETENTTSPQAWIAALRRQR